MKKKPKNCLLTPTEIQQIFQIFAENNPTPTTELHYKNHFELLIAVILSAQATDISVNKATAQLFIDAPTPQDIFDLGEEKLRAYIQSIGLYKNKAKYIINTCQILIQKFESIIPNNRADLESLPGVGRKTANVILNTAFGLPTIAVDTHLFRLGNRIGLGVGKDVLEVERALLANIPAAYLVNAHHWLILHGRYVCTAQKPKCADCVIKDLCKYSSKTG